MATVWIEAAAQTAEVGMIVAAVMTAVAAGVMTEAAGQTGAGAVTAVVSASSAVPRLHTWFDSLPLSCSAQNIWTAQLPPDT